MGTYKKGHETGFKAKGKPIKVGDRIRNINDGLVLYIDKWGTPVGPCGVRYKLKTMDLSQWELYDGPSETKEPAPVQVPADDVAEIAPERVKDPRDCSKGKGKEPAPVQVPADITKTTTDDLLRELSRRGYKISLTLK